MAYHQLTQEERYFISSRRQSGASLREIGQELGRSASTISRELSRNATRHDGAYRPSKAHSYAKTRSKACRRRSCFDEAHWQHVDVMLWQKWSPQQISGRLKRDGELSISHETIYRRIRRDKKAGGHLWPYTRIMSKFARKHYRSARTRGRLPGKRHISERPKEVEGRRRFGHWEGDTVIGADKRHCVLTLVERKSGFAIVKKLSARSAAETNKALSMALAEHAKCVKTITFDNGTEFHSYSEIEELYPIKCYFANPYHSWERGSNENFNGLLRQYLPKGMCMSEVTQEKCDEVARRINNRPRARLKFKTPSEVYYAWNGGVALDV